MAAVDKRKRKTESGRRRRLQREFQMVEDKGPADETDRSALAAWRGQ